MSERTSSLNYEEEYERLRAEMCKLEEERCMYKTLLQEAEAEKAKLLAQMEVVRLIFGRGYIR